MMIVILPFPQKSAKIHIGSNFRNANSVTVSAALNSDYHKEDSLLNKRPQKRLLQES